MHMFILLLLINRHLSDEMCRHGSIREAVVRGAELAQARRHAQPLRAGHQHHRQDAGAVRRGQPHPLLRLRRR
jgi:hypothetical protein